MIDIPTQLSNSGVKSDPASVAVAPSAPCAKSGTKEIAPNIPTPARNPATTETVTTRLRNNSNGMSGSGARRSTHTKHRKSDTAPATSARLRGDKSVEKLAPPSTSASIRSVMATVSSAAPA
jgi:hypothetical protein